MKLPAKTDIFGVEITMELGEIWESFYRVNQETHTLIINSNLSAYGRHVALIRGALHISYSILINKHQVTGDLLEIGATHAICRILTVCKCLDGIGDPEFSKYLCGDISKYE